MDTPRFKQTKAKFMIKHRVSSLSTPSKLHYCVLFLFLLRRLVTCVFFFFVSIDKYNKIKTKKKKGRDFLLRTPFNIIILVMMMMRESGIRILFSGYQTCIYAFGNGDLYRNGMDWNGSMLLCMAYN